MDTYLLIKYLKCSTTPEEEAEVQRWLADDPDGSHAKQYSDAHFLYEGVVLHSRKTDSVHKSGISGVRRAVRYATGIAAAVILAVTVGFISERHAFDKLSARTETVYVPAGKSMQLTLEDGTKLWLNSGTEIEYPVVFSRKSREVKLYSGEALFDVAKDEGRPFTVDTYASTISVLGTRFNVSVDKEMGGFSAALLRGAVKVTSKLREGEEYRLYPNQMVRLSNDNHLYVEQIKDPESVECWKDGLLDISCLPFDMLMRRFEMVYNVNIVMERDNMPEISYLSGKVRVSDGIEHALDMLELASDFTYEYDRRTNTVIIR